MCGIIGVFNKKNHSELVKAGLEIIENRGKYSVNYYSGENYSIGCLQSAVGFLQPAVNFVKQPLVKQPLTGRGIFVSNCEIYNWKELNEKHKLKAENDSHLLFLLLEKKGIGKTGEIDKIKEILDEIDGAYAFAYIAGNKLVLARDILGIKPLWFAHSDGFAFASEKKALENIGSNGSVNSLVNIIELTPRDIIVYDMKKDRIEFIERDFFKIEPEIKESKEEIIDNIIHLLTNAVGKRILQKKAGQKVGVLFSGGVDSGIIALFLKNMGCEFTCYTAAVESDGMKEAEDIHYAEKAAKFLDVPLKIIKIKLNDIEGYLKKIVPLIEDSSVVKVGVALPFYAACEEAKKDGCSVIFSGLGSEEIFAGYERHKKADDINNECLSGLLKIYERDTYRDDVITMSNNLELRLPFLDKSLVEYALKIPSYYKIRGAQTKVILREAALKNGLDKEIAMRKKRAAQYGSNSQKALKKLAKKNGFKLISDYLRKFYPRRDIKLGALVSSGKDSIYAMHVIQKQNYEISCMITLKSRNPDSFMFHTPSVELVELQAKSCGIPLVEEETLGEKEKELEDLKKALQKAKEKYKIEGIITGALFSAYQRVRIERVAESLGLKVFSPLWHMNQETEVRKVIKEFEVIITAVAADGFDETWLGRRIDKKAVEDLMKLHEKNQINVAGEGGEYETLVLNAPLFRKRIRIIKAKKVMNSRNSGIYVIESAELE